MAKKQIEKDLEVPFFRQVTLQEASNIFGVGTRTIEQWGPVPLQTTVKVKPGFRTNTRFFDLKQLVAARMDVIHNQYKGQKATGLDPKAEDAKAKKWKAEKLRLEVEEKAGRLVDIESVEAGQIDVLKTFRSALKGREVQLARQIEHTDALEIRSVLKAEFDLILNEIADKFENLGDDSIEL